MLPFNALYYIPWMFVSDDLVLHLHNSQPGQPDPDSLEMLDMDPDSKDPELQH
jgi:hypothetical protein